MPAYTGEKVLRVENGKYLSGGGVYSELNEYELLTSSWIANPDSSTSIDYPYMYTILTTAYTANSAPIWDLAGSGNLPTSIERESIEMILEAIFTDNSIILYAADQPTSNLKLRVKGA